MKYQKYFFILFISLLLLGFVQIPNNKKYVLIHLVTKQVPGVEKQVKIAVVNKVDLNKLNEEPLRALAAYYSAIAGSNCDRKNCELTSSLGLGEQGSNEHKALIKKWLPNDTVAKKLIEQDCFQSPNGSSSFTNYSSLVFEVNKDTIVINYSLVNYDYGKSHLQKGIEKAIIRGKEIAIVSR